jgi:hypothetical protein
MGWEQRRGRSYYYKKRKVGGKVHSVYTGGGETGEAEALLDALERAHRVKEREEWQRRVEAWEQQDAEVDDYMLQVRRVTAGVLLACGFHKPKRQWRLKRVNRE